MSTFYKRNSIYGHVSSARQKGSGDSTTPPLQFLVGLLYEQRRLVLGVRVSPATKLQKMVLRCLVWVETTSGGRTEVELSGDEIDDCGKVSNGAIAASLCLGCLYEAVDSLNETIGDLAMEPT